MLTTVSRQRGLSVVELMVGVAIGLFIVAGGAKLLADGLVGNRRMIVESRISQDMRAATDVIARDLRRAGFWEQSWLGVTGTPAANVYAAITATPGGGVVNEVVYNYARDANEAVDASTEVFGFQREVVNNVGRINMRVGANWQPLTDVNMVDITAFTISPRVSEIRLGDMCRGSPLGSGGTPPAACCRPHPANGGLCKQDFFERTVSGYAPLTGIPKPDGTDIEPTCPELHIRSFDIVMTGRGRAPNTDVRREIHEIVRVRNDALTGTVCP